MDTFRLRYEYLPFNISQTKGTHMLTLRLRYDKQILALSLRADAYYYRAKSPRCII